MNNDRIGKAGFTGRDELKARMIGALRRLQKLCGQAHGFLPTRTYATSWPWNDFTLNSVNWFRTIG